MRVRLLLLILLTPALPSGTAAAGQSDEAWVSIVSPTEFSATNAQGLHVVVAFQAHGNMREIDLLINGQLLETLENSASIKAGEVTFDVDLSLFADQVLEISVVGYQASREAGLATNSETRHILLDRTPPIVTIIAPVNDAVFWDTPRVPLEITYSDNLAGVSMDSVQATLDGVSITSELNVLDGSATYDPPTPLGQGPHAYVAWAVDRAGNISSQATASFAIETLDIMYLTGSQLKRVNVATGSEMASFNIGPNVFLYAVSENRQRILLDRGTNGWDTTIDVLDVTSGTITHVVNAAWAQTLSFLPGSDSQFVYNDASGYLWMHDLDTSTTAVWQNTDTAAQSFGKNVYRGGISWSGDGSRVIAEIGVATQGGDGVFVGDSCEDAQGHHICNITPVANPAGWSASWATIAFYPSLSSDGRFAYYGERVNFGEHHVWKHDLQSGTRISVMDNPVTVDSGFGAPSLVGDRYLVFTGIPIVSPVPIYVCSVDAQPSCATVQVPTAAYWTVRGICW